MYHFRLGKEEHVEGNEEDTEEEGQAVDGGGIADIATTQIYAKVTSTKLEHDISAFESRIKGHMPTMGGMA